MKDVMTEVEVECSSVEHIDGEHYTMTEEINPSRLWRYVSPFSEPEK